MNEEKDRTEDFYRLAVAYSEYYAGKVRTLPCVPIRNMGDFSIWYTPGVAGVSRKIAKDKELSFHLTGRWNTIAIVSDGSRVLGLGDIGPEGGTPVMEGKALIFKYLGGVDAVPMTVAAHKKEDIVQMVKWIEPAFGGINLEDISSPKCFYVLETLRKELNITIWHDDQQGTAGATLAGLLNALKLTGRNIRDSRIVFCGVGASNIATVRILIKKGADPRNIIMVDSKGTLHAERSDLDSLMLNNPWKYEYALKTNADRVIGGIPEAMKGADVLIAASRPGPGVIKPDWVRSMNDDPIVFSLANPVPEIFPFEAKEAGARIVATGRSDFPNQVNNSLVFPAVFRGSLDARARTVSDEMAIKASDALAKFAEDKGLTEENIIPTMDDWEVFPEVASAVAEEAVRSGIARVKHSRKEFYEGAYAIIERTRTLIKKLMSQGDIAPLPEV